VVISILGQVQDALLTTHLDIFEEEMLADEEESSKGD